MRKLLISIVILASVLLAGCSFGETTEEKLSIILGDIYDAEKTYRDNQKTLQELEETEQQLFNDTMALTKEETDLVTDNVTELQDMLEQRLVIVLEEAESMKKARALVAELDVVAEKAEAEEQVQIAKLKEAIQHRYQTHDLFVENYNELTALQKELYEMLLEKETEATKLDEHVDAINEENQEVMLAVEEFNKATVELNQIREEVFESIKKNE